MKIFLNYSKNDRELQQQVFKRIKDPLLTLLMSCEVNNSFELQFTILQHIYFIISKDSSEFKSSYKIYYCREDEPTYIKNIKIQILILLTNEENLGNILNEIGEYVVKEELTEAALEGLGKIALKMENMAIPILKQLSMYLQFKENSITNSVIKQYRHILLKYPKLYDKVELNQNLDEITDIQSKTNYLELLGEFGNYIDESSYILEQYVD